MKTPTLTFAFVAISLFLLIAIGSHPTSATTVVIVNETEESFYSISQIELTGDLKANQLHFTGNGNVLSNKAKVYLFGQPQDMGIEGATLNGERAIISFDGKAYYIVAQKGPISFSGDLTFKTLGQIKLQVPGPVNNLLFDINNGYAVGGNAYGAFNREITLQRNEETVTNVDGNYKYTYAERNSFEYRFSFQAFGTTLSTYNIPLNNQEQVSEVQGALKWEVRGNELLLELESDQANVVVIGFFATEQILPPIQTRGTLVIESDPEKKLTIETDAKEIDVSEAGIRPDYPNARAFLASNQNMFSISIKQLDLMPSLSASVNTARQSFALTDEGSILGTMNYNYDNTGVEYLLLDSAGTPLYAATNQGPVKLTKDPSGEEKLFLSLPKSRGGSLDYTFFTTRSAILPIDLIKVPLVQTDLPISTMTTTFFMPGEWFVLKVFGAEGGTELPSIYQILVFAILVGLVGYFLLADKKFIAAYIVLCAGLFYFSSALFYLLLVASIIFILKKYIEAQHVKWILIGLGVLVVLGLIIAVLYGIGSLFGESGNYATTNTRSAVFEEADIAPRAPAPTFAAMKVGQGGGAITVPTKKGVLPVDFMLPQMGKSITVTNHLVTKEKQPSLSILVVSSYFVYLIYLLAIFAGVYCKKKYFDQDRPQTTSSGKSRK